jgi:hypothetical protein
MVKFLCSYQWARIEAVLLTGDNERTSIWIARPPAKGLRRGACAHSGRRSHGIPEHQTARDSTTGHERPIGDGGAAMAERSVDQAKRMQQLRLIVCSVGLRNLDGPYGALTGLRFRSAFRCISARDRYFFTSAVSVRVCPRAPRLHQVEAGIAKPRDAFGF